MSRIVSLVLLFVTSLSILFSPVPLVQAQNEPPRVSVNVQFFYGSPTLQVVLSPTHPGMITRIKSIQLPFEAHSELSPDKQWIVFSESIPQADRLVCKHVGAAKTEIIASGNDAEKITSTMFDRTSHYLLYIVSPFDRDYSTSDFRWSINIIDLESGARTTLNSRYRRIKESGCTAGHVMTEIRSLLDGWDAADKRLLFLTSMLFNERGDPQFVPTGFDALDLSKFDLNKGGVFAMPSLTEFYRVNRGKDVCACEASMVERETSSPDSSHLAFTFALYCARISTEPITVLDLKTGHLQQLPIDWPQEINTHGVRALAWTADGRQLVYITVKHPLLAEEGEAYLQVFDLASDSVVHRAAIDLEGKSIWVGAQVCGDTAFLMGISKHERRSLYRLYSAPLAHPEDQTELFNGYALGNLACEPG